MPSGVSRLPAPASWIAHCARSGLAPLEVFGFPLATTGSTRLLPARDAYTALARQPQSGPWVSACAEPAPPSTASAASTTAAARRLTRRVLGVPTSRAGAPKTLAMGYLLDLLAAGPPWT